MLQVLTKVSVCSTHMYHYYAYIYAIEHVYTWCDVDPLGRSSFRWPTASELDLVAADAVPVVESHRRRYGVGWNHIGDDTASAGSPELHISAPPLFNPSPFQSFPLPIQSAQAAARRMKVLVADIKSPAAKPVLLCQQAAQAGYTKAFSALVYRSRGPWCYETPVQTH